MPTKTLTDRFVATVKPTTRLTYFDAKARGLTLRIQPSGSRTWYFVYRHGGPSQWLKLGAYPALPLSDARTLARDHRHSIDVEGKDPAAERRAPDPEPEPPPPALFTFADFIPVFIALSERPRTHVGGRSHEDRQVSPPVTKTAATAATPAQTSVADAERMADYFFDAYEKAMVDGDRSAWDSAMTGVQTYSVSLGMLDALVMRFLFDSNEKNRARNQQIKELKEQIKGFKEQIEGFKEQIENRTLLADAGGVWDEAKYYRAGDVCQRDGSSWVAKVDGPRAVPGNGGGDWHLLRLENRLHPTWKVAHGSRDSGRCSEAPNRTP